MVLHRPGWMPGQADWSAPPKSAERNTVEDTPRRGGAVMVEAGRDANPVEGTPSGQVESSLPWNPSSTAAGTDVDLPDAHALDWGQAAGEDPVEANASGQVEPAPSLRRANPLRPATAPAAAAAAAATATNPAAAAAAAQENLAATAAKRVSTRARACQGREGQGRELDREGSGWETGGAGQGEPASPRRRRPRRKRQVRNLGASPEGSQPMPNPSPAGLAGEAPSPQVGGQWGSPWYQWRGRPPVDDDAVCPTHGADVPCRFCLEEEPC